MKNRNKFTFIFFFIYLLTYNYSHSSESFNFNITEIEIKENGNKFIGKNKGTARSIDGTTIDANNFEYNKTKNILISSGRVKLFDPENNITIYSDKVTYLKNNELIFTNGNSKIVGVNFQIDAKNFEYNKLKNLIFAQDKVKINNKKENYLILSDEISYYRNDELIFANGNSKIIDNQVEIDANNFEYNKLSNIISATGNVKINNKKENYLILSDQITYNKKIGKVFTKNNSKALSKGITINAEIFNYDEKKNILEAKGKVKIEDKIVDYILETEYVNYDRNFQKIFTKGKTKTLIEKKYEFNSKDIFLDRNLREFKSDNFSTIKDDNSNFYKLSKFLYFYDEKLLRGNDIEVETNYKQEKGDKFFFKNAFINFLDGSYISKDTRINIHKKVFDKERTLDGVEENIFVGENDPRIYGSSSLNKGYLVLNS